MASDNPPLKLSVDTLPALPYVAHEILLKLNQPTNDLKDISDAISKEPGLTARVIAMANSAFFAGQRQLHAVDEAVVRVGMNRVRVVAASILLADQFDSTKCPHFEAERYWSDAVKVAFCATRVARHFLNEEGTDAAYLAGLLHNIGLLLLAHCFPADIDHVLEKKALDEERSLGALTRSTLGFDHHEAARLLLSEWELPQPTIKVAAHYAQAHYSGEFQDLIRVIQFCIAWSESDFSITPPFNELAPLSDDLQKRISLECQRELENIQAFAALLAE